MKLTVLVDNNTIIDSYYLGEPGLSFYIEDGDKKILFDTGYSDVFMLNAKKMGIDLKEINTLVLSHGHNDHTGGLVHLFSMRQAIDVYAHPDVDGDKEHMGLDISSPVILDTLPHNFSIHKSKEAVKVSEHITFLGEIERSVQPLRPLESDPLYDDTAMVYENEEGIFIITGCSHSGIANIIEQAKKITGKDNIIGVIGGFHLLNSDELNKEVCNYCSHEKIKKIYPCHCTDLKAKIALSKVLDVNEIGVGYSLEVK